MTFSGEKKDSYHPDDNNTIQPDDNITAITQSDNTNDITI
jgi:hypothetical protein